MKSWQSVKRLAASAVLACFSVAAAIPAQAAEYPEKPIRIIVPFSAGGATDMLARTVGQKLQESWGQPVVVDNRPGAGGNIGAEAGARAAPDGYTLLLVAAGFMAVNPHVYSNLTYDSIEDFAPITQLVSAPLLLVTHPSVPVKNFQEYVALVKSQPGKFLVGNGGPGTAQHLGGEYLDMTADMKSLHVPYKGSAPATADLLGGQVQAMLDNMVTLIPHVKAGKLRAIAVTSKERVSNLPDVPTVSESGLPGFETGTWYGIVAPAGTPKPIVDKLHREIVRILELPDVREKFLQQGLQPVGNTPEQFAEYIAAERKKAGEIVKAANIKVN
ncbi:MAG: tripartite tricarboxylate transporter substrate binding protein [Limnobacter sp.]|nr:tripartite tricarboxylate transporter substrate binding protein [Limnobacter sp.]